MEANRMKPRVQRTTSAQEKKLQDRMRRLAQDTQRTDGTSMRDTDLQKWVAPPVSWSYQNIMAMATRQFKEFIGLMGPDDPQITIKEPEEYFCHGAQHLTLELLKLYVLYLARTSAGTLDERITVTTIRNYIAHILCAVYRASGGKKQLDQTDLRQIYAYIAQLTLEGEVSRKTRAKSVATKNDLDVILELLFSDGFALKIHDVKLVLKVALYINLYVDSCSRGSDLAWGGRNVAKEQNHCLCWDHCDFYVVCSDDGDRVVAANIRLIYQKGHATMDRHKTVTLRLLPTVMAMQDSLRLLVTLALVDGVFGAGVTWMDLLAIDPDSHSRKIHQSDSFIGVPVFRNASNNPYSSLKLGEQIQKLGRMAGFEHNATPYSLRRGYANVLYARVSAEDRRFLMGHTTNSDAYSHYHSAISTINVQEVFRGVRAGNAAEMHALSLNRIPNIPQQISKEGWQSVQEDSEVVKAAQDTSQMTADLQEFYRSVSAAVCACDYRVKDLVEATARLKNRRTVLTRAIYQEEYRRAFKGYCAQSDKNASHPSCDVDNNATLADASDWVLQVTQEEEAVMLLDDCDTTNAVETDRHGDDDKTIDDLEPSMADDDFELNVQSTISFSQDLSERSETIRRHKINDGSAIPKTMSITRFRDAVKLGGYTDATLSDLMIEVFSAAHKSGKFIPGEEPLLGTYTCRFSGVDLSSDHKAPETAHCAHAKMAKQTAGEAFEQHLLPLDQPCSYYCQGPVRLTDPKICSVKSFKTRQDQRRHTHMHTTILHKTYYAANLIPRGEWRCYYDGCAILMAPAPGATIVTLSSGSIFSSERDYHRHVYQEHRLSPLAPETVVWCGICERFLEWEQFGTGKDDHFAPHWEEVWSLVKDHGYCGQYDNGRRTIPSFCPFCLHDEDLSPAERISATMSQLYLREWADHIARHIDAFDSSSTFLCPCFPLTCTYSQEMLPQELASHLSSIHNIKLPNTSRKQRRGNDKKRRTLDEKSTNSQGETEGAKPSKKSKKSKK